MSTDLSTNAVDECTPETILSRVDEAICALNTDWEVTFVNERAVQFLDRSPEELLGKSVWEAVPGITETAVGDELREAMATQTPTRFESYNETLDRWVKVRIYPDEDGATACFYDITDERGRQLDLQRQRRLFETVFDETEDALVVADTDRRITDFNPAAEQLFGYEAEEVLGEKSRVLYADSAVYDQQGEERFNEHSERTEETYLVEYERADGSTFIGETLGTPLEGPDDETLAFLGSIRDVSAQVEYEQALEATTQRLNIALEGTQTGVWEFRPETEKLVWTDSMEQLCGFGLEAYEGFLDSIHPNDRSEVANAFDSATDPGDTFQLACRFEQADGSYLWVEARAELIAGDDSPQRLVGIVTDISERKEREQQLRRERSRLRALFDSSPDGITIHDDEGSVIDMNETQLESLGFEWDDLDSLSVTAYEDDISLAELQTIWADMETGEPLQVESTHRRQNGETFPVEVWVNKFTVNDEERFIAVARDITDRKQRDAELQRSQGFLERAQESAAIGGWEIDLEADSLRWTDEVYRIHDLSPDATVSIDDGIEFYHPDDRPTIEAAFERLQTEGESYDLELRIVTAEDRVRWVRTVGDPQFDEEGEVVGVVGVFQDITDRKQREQELAEIRERLDLAIEGANLGVWDWDMETDTVEFNEQWASMLGFSPGELEPTLETWEARVHPDDIPTVEAALDAHIVGDEPLYDCEHRLETKAGEWRWINAVGKVVDRAADGSPKRAVGIHIDITEEKESKLYLEEERDMFAEGPAVVFKWRNDEDWPVEYVSENVADVFGYTPEELTSGTVPYADLILDDDIGRVMREVTASSDADTNRFTHEPYRMVTKTGEIRWVRDNTKIIRTDGEITHYLGYLIDITEQKRLERSLRESERAVRELTSIAADTDRSFDEKLTALLELGTDQLGLPIGFLNRLDDDTQHVEQAVGDHPAIQSGVSAPRSESYCRKTVQHSGPLDVQDAAAEGWEDDPAYDRFDLGCYIGGTVTVDGEMYGTLCFADHNSRAHEFSDSERAFVKLLVQWISHELTTQAFETRLRDINESAQELMTVPDRSQIAALAVESTQSILEMPISGIWWYDEEENILDPVLQSDAAAEHVPEQPVFEPGNTLAWEAFESGELRVYDDLGDVDGKHNEATIFESEVIVPLGDHGILTASALSPRAFSEMDRNLLEVLSSTIESALTRSDREMVLRETQAELEQSNEELEQFAYAASHDLQEPLRTLSSYLTLLERRYEDELDAEAVEFIEFAVDGADRMQQMIEALLAYSRVDTSGEAFEAVAVSDLLDAVTESLQFRIDEADATVSVPDTDATVTGDESQLAQLVQNLVENGIKYSSEPPEIDISVDHDETAVTIEIADNGIGIPADQQDGIFEVFQRLHTHEEFSGTGIGLSICRKIVDRHDADITVDSEPGVGSTFTITLPNGAAMDE
ncbi:MAG: PAS sensor histidine kinase [Halonotius sp. J07HN6]|jgi:PAS domain S-box|nr:MAG: PAS sensor histidine kinase [Halonotius sp. J07HN6]